MQFGPCIHCGRIILLASGAQACGTCHILSTAEREQEKNEQTADNEHDQQQNGNDRNDQESNVVHLDQHDNLPAPPPAAIDNLIERPNVMDLQTAIGREDLPQMLQRFLRYFYTMHMFYTWRNRLIIQQLLQSKRQVDSLFIHNDAMWHLLWEISQQAGATESEIAALDRRILEMHDPECGTECAICTELFETMELARLPCNHEYHSECIHHWLKLNSSCPMCRQSISDHEQQQKHQQQGPIPSTQSEPDLIIMRREMADRMYLENAPLHYMDDVD